MPIASNIRAQRNREQGKDVNPKLVTTAILKNVAEFPKISLDELMSRTKFPEEAIRNYARNYAEAIERLTGGTERLSEIAGVTVHPMTKDRVDDWLRFFDHDGFAGNPDWASCYCLEPHVPATPEQPERAWRETRAIIAERLQGVTFLDVGQTATSAVYAIFDPAETKRSLGILMMLRSLEFSRQRGYRYYYPGYAYQEPFIYDYKKRFIGLEYLDWKSTVV